MIHIAILFTFWSVVTHDLGKVTTGLRAVLGRRAWALENALAILSIFTFSLVKLVVQRVRLVAESANFRTGH